MGSSPGCSSPHGLVTPLPGMRNWGTNLCWANRHHAYNLFIPFLPQSVLPWPGLNSTESRVLGEQLVSQCSGHPCPMACSEFPSCPCSAPLPVLTTWTAPRPPIPGSVPTSTPAVLPDSYSPVDHMAGGSAPPLQRAWHPNWCQTNG